MKASNRAWHIVIASDFYLTWALVWVPTALHAHLCASAHYCVIGAYLRASLSTWT